MLSDRLRPGLEVCHSGQEFNYWFYILYTNTLNTIYYNLHIMYYT